MHNMISTFPHPNGTTPQLTPWQVAVTLARFYGIAETLHPWPYLDNERFFQQIEAWTQEYLESGGTDLLHFLEEKLR